MGVKSFCINSMKYSTAVSVAVCAIAIMAPPSLFLIPFFDAVDTTLNYLDDSANLTANNRFLKGPWVPLKSEQRTLLSATFPSDLSGVFLRNGPNAAHPPLSKSHMFDGDGMVHSFFLQVRAKPFNDFDQCPLCVTHLFWPLSPASRASYWATRCRHSHGSLSMFYRPH